MKRKSRRKYNPDQREVAEILHRWGPLRQINF